MAFQKNYFSMLSSRSDQYKNLYEHHFPVLLITSRIFSAYYEMLDYICTPFV